MDCRLTNNAIANVADNVADNATDNVTALICEI